MSRKSKSLIALSIFGLLFLPSSPAFAHAQISATSPIQYSAVSEVPSEVSIEFDGNLTQIEDLTINVLKVFNSEGIQIDDGKTLVGGAKLTIGVKDRSGSGTFRVTYRVVSEDGHPITDEFTFEVMGKAASPSAVAIDPQSPYATTTTEGSTSETGDEVLGAKVIAEKETHHESFLVHHRTHIFQFVAVALLILLWWFGERRRKK
jgi:methionine-rich copper-binding protein CopC